MPAVSKAQQRLFGVVHALQTGKIKPKDMPAKFRKKAEQAATSMSKKAVTHFADTKTKNLPTHVSESPTVTLADFLAVNTTLASLFEGLTDDELTQLEQKYQG